MGVGGKMVEELVLEQLSYEQLEHPQCSDNFLNKSRLQ